MFARASPQAAVGRRSPVSAWPPQGRRAVRREEENIPGRRRPPLAGSAGPRGPSGARPPSAPFGADPGPGRRRPSSGPGRPRRRVLPSADRRAATLRSSRHRARGCEDSPKERLRTGRGHVFLFLFKPAAPKGAVAGLWASSGVARPSDSRSAGRGRRRPAGRWRGWASVLHGRPLGNQFLPRLRSRLRGVWRDPREVCYSPSAHPECAALHTVGVGVCVGVWVCVCVRARPFFPAFELLSCFYLLDFYPLSCQLCFQALLVHHVFILLLNHCVSW